MKEWWDEECREGKERRKRELREWRKDAKDNDSHAEAARYVSFRAIRSFMQQCRKKNYPPNPRTIQEFVDRLTDPQFARILEYINGRLTVRSVTDDSGAQHAILYDEDFVRREMSEVTKLLIDATFCTRPRIEGVYQLMTIMGIKLNHGFPFIWVLMTRKTQGAYESCLRYIREHVLQAHIILVMSDFERALRNAVLQVYPMAHSTGCNTHYDRAIYRKAKVLQLANVLRTNDVAKTFFKKVLALAYLPAELITTKFRELHNNLPGTLKTQFRTFCNYYDRYWIRTVRPEGFSVYGLSRRTNNIIESYHSRLQHHLGRRPGPWDFLCKILKLQSKIQTDIARLKNNVNIGRHARYSTVFKQNKLTKAWRQLHMLEITVEEFMDKAASLKGNIDFRMAQQLTEQENDEIQELQEPPAIRPLDPDFEQEIFAEEPPRWLLDNAENGNQPIVVNEEIEGYSSPDENEHNPDDLIANDLEEVVEEAPQLRNIEDDPVELMANDLEEVVEEAPQPRNIENQPIVIDEEFEAYSTPGDNEDDPDELIADGSAAIEEAPQPRNIAVGAIRRQSNSVIRNEFVVGPASEPNSARQKRNKRRKAMRKRAVARRFAERREESAETQEQEERREESAETQEQEERREESAETQEQEERREESAETQEQEEPQEAENRRHSEENNDMFAKTDCSFRDSCKVCLLAKATHLYLPCGHCCCCSDCAEVLWNQFLERRCPICRTRASEAPRRIFQPSEF
ncbi:uncharacterized protein [Venturia canescens]|uniref:uncharacterized protein isoform X1 n=2 Tax=Venturia canescens TaxID=32260 RepID=UPI001C9BDEBB|nr:uncharacterized protein LOC122417333 isoform X1 [Venturia canescens]